MPSALRSVLAVIAGIGVGVGVVSLFDLVVSRMYPPPPGMDMSNPESIRQVVSAMPVPAFIILLVGWTVASAAAAYIAARVAPRAPMTHALIAAAFLFTATLLNLMLVPHPTWMLPTTLILLPATAVVTARAMAGRAAARRAAAKGTA